MEISNTVSGRLKPLIWRETDKDQARKILTKAFAEKLFVGWARPQFLVFDEDYNIVSKWWWIDFKWNDLESLDKFLISLKINALKRSEIIAEMEALSDGEWKDSVKLIKSEDWSQTYSIIFKRRQLDKQTKNERWVVQSTIAEAGYIASLNDAYRKAALAFLNNFDSWWFNWEHWDNLEKLRQYANDLTMRENLENFELLSWIIAEIKDLALDVFDIANINDEIYTSDIPAYSQKSVETPKGRPSWEDTKNLIEKILSWEVDISENIINQIVEIRKFIWDAIPTFVIAPSWVNWPVYVLNNEHEWEYSDFTSFAKSFEVDGCTMDQEKIDLLSWVTSWNNNVILWDGAFSVASKYSNTDNGLQFTITPNKYKVPDPISINNRIRSLFDFLTELDENDESQDVRQLSTMVKQAVDNMNALYNDLGDIAENNLLDKSNQSPISDIRAFENYLRWSWFEWNCDIWIQNEQGCNYRGTSFALLSILTTLQQWNLYNSSSVSDISLNFDKTNDNIVIDMLFKWNQMEEDELALVKEKLVLREKSLDLLESTNVFNEVVEAINWIEWWEIEVNNTPEWVTFSIKVKSFD